MRIRISRKEAKELAYWLRLLLETNETPDNRKEIQDLYAESIELKRIFQLFWENQRNE